MEQTASSARSVSPLATVKMEGKVELSSIELKKEPPVEVKKEKMIKNEDDTPLVSKVHSICSKTAVVTFTWLYVTIE